MLGKMSHYFLTLYNNINRSVSPFSFFIGPGFFPTSPGFAPTIDLKRLIFSDNANHKTSSCYDTLLRIYWTARSKNASNLILVHKWMTKYLLVIKRPAFPLYALCSPFYCFKFCCKFECRHGQAIFFSYEA